MGEEDEPRVLGQRVKKAREKRGLLQRQLANMCGMPEDSGQAIISALEKRESKTSEYLFELADALKVNPRWLQTGEGVDGLEGEWRATPELPKDEAQLIADYRAASDAWKLTTRLFVRAPPEDQAELSRDMNILMTTIFGKAVGDDRLGDGWTRPDIPRQKK